MIYVTTLTSKSRSVLVHDPRMILTKYNGQVGCLSVEYSSDILFLLHLCIIVFPLPVSVTTGEPE